MTKVYLGGTWNRSTWRERMIAYLSEKEIDWFNPIVSDWTKECRAQEIRERECCDFVLYTITPKMTGVYSIAEAVDDSNKKPDKTILVLLQKDEGLSFSKSQWKSLEAVADMIRRNGGHVFYDLESAAAFVGREKHVEDIIKALRNFIEENFARLFYDVMMFREGLPSEGFVADRLAKELVKFLKSRKYL